MLCLSAFELYCRWVPLSSFALIEYYCGHFMTLSQDLLHESFFKKIPVYMVAFYQFVY